MANNDPSGYYRALNVPPNATSEAIKAAYRNLAKKLHPDVSNGVDTTAAFQSVQEAYGVLGDDNRRAQYDASGAVPSGQSHSQGASQRHIDPVTCSDCGCITAQPRFKVFYFVIGYLFGAYKKPIRGIYCAGCDLKTAMKATITTVFLG